MIVKNPCIKALFHDIGGGGVTLKFSCFFDIGKGGLPLNSHVLVDPFRIFWHVLSVPRPQKTQSLSR